VNVIDKYNELGFQGCYITKDSIIKNDDNTVNIELWVEEGNKYISSGI
jgi:outer membrane protein insertion porin family